MIKQNKKIPIETIFVILAIIWMAIMTPFKTRDVLADQLSFGSKLEAVQTEYADLYLLQKSIAICEGGLNEDSLAWRNNNPGNLKAGGYTDHQGHTIYRSRLEGYLNHLNLLQRKYWGLTPYQMNRTYATDKKWWKCVQFYYYGY